MHIPGYTPSSAWSVFRKWLDGCAGKGTVWGTLLGPIWEMDKDQLQLMGSTLLVILLTAVIVSLKFQHGFGRILSLPMEFLHFFSALAAAVKILKRTFSVLLFHSWCAQSIVTQICCPLFCLFYCSSGCGGAQEQTCQV